MERPIRRPRYTFLRVLGYGWDRGLWLPSPGLRRHQLWREVNRAAEEAVRNLPDGEHLEHLSLATLVLATRLKGVPLPPEEVPKHATVLSLDLSHAVVSFRNSWEPA